MKHVIRRDGINEREFREEKGRFWQFSRRRVSSAKKGFREEGGVGWWSDRNEF